MDHRQYPGSLRQGFGLSAFLLCCVQLLMSIVKIRFVALSFRME